MPHDPPSIPKFGPMSWPGPPPPLETASDLFALLIPVLKEAGCIIIFQDRQSEYLSFALPNGKLSFFLAKREAPCTS